MFYHTIRISKSSCEKVELELGEVFDILFDEMPGELLACTIYEELSSWKLVGTGQCDTRDGSNWLLK